MPPPYTTIKVNKAALTEAVFNSYGMPKYLTALARAVAYDEYLDRRNEMLEEVDDNPISQEIAGGNADAGGILEYGNLFSYIGFKDGTSPIQTLKAALLTSTSFEPIPTRNMRIGRFYFKVLAPTREEIGRETAKDLGSLSVDSWPHALEEGLTNLSNYLYDDRGLRRSNSGTGLQLKHKVADRTFPNLQNKYITAILNKLTRGYTRNAE